LPFGKQTQSQLAQRRNRHNASEQDPVGVW
jgi:hypothetical protein